MIKLGRVSHLTRGAFVIQEWVEDALTCLPGNQQPRSVAGCPG